MVKIVYTGKFARNYKKLSHSIKIQAERKEQLFRKEPFDSRLKTHKLKGNLSEFWSFSITYQYRIVFEFDSKSKNIVYFYDVGDHDVYQ